MLEILAGIENVEAADPEHDCDGEDHDSWIEAAADSDPGGGWCEPEGQAEHNFSLTEANVNQDLEKGDSKTISFTAPAAGTYQYFCEYHKTSKNMVGTIKVT